MSDEQQGFGVSRTSIVSILAAALLASYYGQHLLLKDTRPAVEASNSTAPGLQQIDARLWEDPLFAVQQEAGDRSGKDTVADTCASASKANATRTLLVIVPGGPYQQAAETRRRTRYAVITALHTSGYEPEDPEHLGCFQSSPQAGEIANGKTPSLIPFELFAPDDGVNPARPRLSVVWVDENRLRGDAGGHFRTLAAIQNDFRNVIGLSCNLDTDVRIIGPSSSRVLFDLAINQNNAPRDMRFRIFNYQATIAAEATINQSKMPAFESDDCKDDLSTQPTGTVSLCPVIAPDDKLADLLAKEIKQHSNGPPHVALIYESDTIYGRKLYDTVRGKLKDMCATKDGARDPCTIAALTYLRGLDGSLPSLGKAGPAAPTQPARGGATASHELALPTLASARPYEAAEGNGQIDYLEHLPGPLHLIEQQSSATSGPFTAIGLLGTDVYDKLLLLRALKPRFPNAVFFTTDLDARLFDPSEFPTTRGLIVASSYGLRVKNEAEIPSFRDSYQTAAFLATRLAALSSSEPRKDAAPTPAMPPVPKLFEIGRWGAFSLKDSPAATDEGPTPGLRKYRRVGCLIMAIGSWLFLVLEFGLLRRPIFAAALFLLFGAGLLLLDAIPLVPLGFAKNILSDRGLGEPLSFTAGISLWPIIGLRVLGTLFCLYAVDRIYTKLAESARSLIEDYNLNPNNAKTKSTPWPEVIRTFGRGAWRAAFPLSETQRNDTVGPPQVRKIDPSIYDSETSPYNSVQGIWDRLKPWDKRPRLLRVSIYTVVSILSAGILVAIFGEGYIPARAPCARNWYRIATFLNIVAMQYLIMLVFDATSFSSYFIRQVRKVDSGWPAETVARFRATTGLPNGRLLADWIDMQMIADRTGCIIDLIYFPFIALSIFTVSQTSVFDDVPPSIPVLASTTVGFGLLFYIAIRLRAEAERIRREAIERFEKTIRAQSVIGEPRNLITCLAAVKDFRKGAFMRLSQQPLIRAILLPLSSLGGSALLQQLLSP